MKILLVSTNEGGGAGIACRRLHLSLLKQGMDSRLLFLNAGTQHTPKSTSFRKFLKEKGDIGKVVSFFKEEWARRIGQKKIAGYPPPAELFRFPDSVHDITAHPYYEWADVINLHWVEDFLDWKSFFKKNKKPIVWSLHDMGPFSGGFSYETGLDKTVYKKHIAEITATKIKCLESQKVEIVGLSKWLNEASKNSKVFKNFKHHNIPNGLSLENFRLLNQGFCRELLQIPKDKKMLLFSSISLKNERKGISILLDSLKHIEKGSVDIVLLGSIQENIEIPGFKVHQIGRISDFRMINAVYCACDALAFPSIEDNLPNVVLEALFSGLPVVGFKIGGVPDMLKHLENGILCDTTTSKDLANGIVDVLSTSFNRESIRQAINSRFSESIQAKAYIKVFEEII